MSARRQITAAQAAKWPKATKSEKTAILDAVVATTGWHRDHARRAIRQAAATRGARSAPPPRRSRPPAFTYGADIVAALRWCWACLDGPNGQRLHAALPALLPLLALHGELVLPTDITRHLDVSHQESRAADPLPVIDIKRRLDRVSPIPGKGWVPMTQRTRLVSIAVLVVVAVAIALIWALKADPSGAADTTASSSSAPDRPSSSSPSTPSSVSVPSEPPAPITGPGTLTWSNAEKIIAPQTQLTSVSCATPTYCLATDTIGTVVRYDGKDWTRPAELQAAAALAGTKLGQPKLNAVSCPATDRCFAVGFDLDSAQIPLLTYNGTAWSANTATGTNPGSGLSDLSCPTTTFCVAAGAAGDVTSFNGTTWSTRSTDLESIMDVSCASATFCVAVSGSTTADAIVFDGTEWSAAKPIPGLLDVSAVGCHAPTSCVAMGTMKEATSDGRVGLGAVAFNGSTWSAPVAAPEAGPTNSVGSDIDVSCVSGDFCAITGRSVNATFSPATGWLAVSPDAALHGKSQVSCVSTTFCVAVAQAESFPGTASRYDGTNWTTTVIHRSQGVLTSISCPTTGFCAALDSGGTVLTRSQDGAWSTTAIDSGQWSSISCTGPTFCAAVGYGVGADNSGGAMSTFDGVSWTLPRVDTAVASLLKVSCATPTFCVAVGIRSGQTVEGASFIWNGTDWGSALPSGVAAGFNGVSCPVVDHCLIVGSGGLSDPGPFVALTLDSGIYGPSAAFGTTDGSFDSVWCRRSDSCVAVGLVEDGGAASAVLDGLKWGPVTQLLGNAYRLVSVTCPSDSFCVAIPNPRLPSDVMGPVEFDGTTWKASKRAPGGEWAAVSCASPEFCVAVASDGTAAVVSH